MVSQIKFFTRTQAMVHQLANNVFSYRRIVQGLSPIMWFHMDLLAPDFTAHLSLAACTYVFTLLPIVALICLRLCHGLRKLFQGSLCCRILLSTVPLAVGILTYAILGDCLGNFCPMVMGLHGYHFIYPFSWFLQVNSCCPGSSSMSTRSFFQVFSTSNISIVIQFLEPPSCLRSRVWQRSCCGGAYPRCDTPIGPKP